MSPARTQETTLRELARRWGIASSYRDGMGRRRQVPSETLVMVLRSLGAPVRGPRDAREAIRAWTLQQWNTHAEPVVVAWEGRVPPVSVRLPATLDGTRVRARLILETGKRRNLSWDLGALPTSGRATVSGRTFVQKDLPLEGPLPFGYHRLALETGGGVRKTLLISSPRRSFQPPAGERRWGVFLPLYALHSRGSWGAGDLTDLRRLVEWTGGRGGGIVASLPLLASFLDHPYEPSPYRPASRLFWNELYLDVPRAVRMVGGDRTRSHLSKPELRKGVKAVRVEPLVDYPGVSGLKRRILEDLTREIMGHACPSRREFNTFLRMHPETAKYARFRAAREPGPEASEPSGGFADPDGPLLHPNLASRRYHAFTQWIFERQMEDTSAVARRLGVYLYLDLPLGVHPEGFDIWRYPDSFVQGMSVGAPPDVLFRSGQEWGFPPLHPERARVREYAYLRAVLRHHLRFASVLRIDHVMGLHRLFWVPQGRPPDQGTYVRYPAEELYAILSLESHRHRSILVGENLGTVPAYVNASLRRHGISPLYVLHYDLETKGIPSMGAILPETVASLNSHDLPPFAAYWRGMDIEEREARSLMMREGSRSERRERARIREGVRRRLRALGRLHGAPTESAVLRALLGSLATSAAWAVIVNLEDLWFETSPQNLPGTGPEVPNWRRKSRRSFEDFAADPSVAEVLSFVNAARKSRRGPRERSASRTKEEGS